MHKRFAAVLAIPMIMAQPAFAAHVLGDASIYTSGLTDLSGNGHYGTVVAGSIKKSGHPDYVSAGLPATTTLTLLGEADLVSTYYQSIAPTAFSITGNTLHGVSGVNVINLSGATLASLAAFDAAGATQLIINVSGPFSASGGFNFSSLLGAENMLFNFYDGGLVKLAGNATLAGSVLATNSLVSLAGNSSVLGSVFAENFKGVGNASVVGARFTGLSVSAVPEPAAWALMILGFGAIGARLRWDQRQQLQLKTARI